MDMKVCSLCGTNKPYSEYHKDKSHANGIRSACKVCLSSKSSISKRLAELKAQGLRECKTCGEVKDLRLFKQTLNSRGYTCYAKTCLPCDRERRNAYARNNWIKNTYGITQAEYNRMLESQNGLCANPTCMETATVVDHDHSCCPGKRSCGKCVRGLLCHGCNAAEGFLKGDPNKMIGLAEYMIMNTRGDGVDLDTQRKHSGTKG